MLFNSQAFILGFLPLVLGGYYLLAAQQRAREAFLVAASLVFYGWWDIRFVPLLAGLTIANWLIVQWFGFRRTPAIPLLGIVLNLAVLALFKYADFLRGTAFSLLGLPWHPWHLVLPLGISFFVFQKLSYLIDLRRGEQRIYGFFEFCAFVTFFPQLIAGPLVRHNEIIGQFARDPRHDEVFENLSRGFVLFLIGLVKKVALADSLAIIADPLFAQAAAGPLPAGPAWLAAGAYTLQIYFDFSGYSDMAIGLARMFGLRLPINFNAPYRADSIRDFWRRWHITLSRFLRDYLYIPLGGNRCGPVRQIGNLLATMLLAGLWHGAGWTFVAWGGLHGVALAINHAWEKTGLRLPRPIGIALTLLFVIAGWVLFRAANFATASRMLAGMIGRDGLGRVVLDHDGMIALAAGAAIAVLGPTSQEAALARLRPHPALALPAGCALVYMLLMIGGRLQHAFIYFQF